MKINGKDITDLLALNRRNFIKLIVGGAVGTGLSPLPWKLTDDIAIWTQNFPWLNVPPVGEFLHEKTVCKLCPGGCGIEVRKVDERAVKIEGRTDYPVNPGGICPLGMGGLQLLYNEQNRFTHPKKRVGSRGSGKFIDISWDEALEILAERISALSKRGNAGSFAAVDGNPAGSTMALMVEHLLKAVGSPNYMRIPSAEDTSLIAGKLMMGSRGPVSYDLENSDFVLSFGAGLLEGWGAPGRVINAWGMWKDDSSRRKCKIVQIESRASNTASKADQWIAARPGTEAALVLGIANVIIREGLHDSEFLENSTSGFSDWTTEDGDSRTGFSSVVKARYTPDKVSKITGVDSDVIVSVAREFAKAKAPVAVCGKGKGSLNGSLYEFMSVYALNALVGSIDKSGGMFINDPLPGIFKDMAVSGQSPNGSSLINNLTESILNDSGVSVDTLFVFSANPAYTLPDGGDFKRALARVPFIVSFSPYYDETSLMADLVLPDHNPLERMDDIVWPAGLQYPLYGLSRPVVDPLYNTRNSGDVIIELAKRIGDSVKSAFPWKNYEAVLKVRAKNLFDSAPGLTKYDGSPVWENLSSGSEIKPDYDGFDKMWKALKRNGLWYRPVNRYRGSDIQFNTPSGKFEFFSNGIKAAADSASLHDLGVSAAGDEAFMPHYETTESEAGGHDYPLTMVPYEMINLSSGWLPNPPYLNKTLLDNQLLKDESFTEINPKTAKEYGLKQGDRVTIKSSKGEVTVRINLFEGAMPGIVYLPMGLGHTAYDDFIRGKGVNPNQIIDGGKDPLSGQPVWWNTPVKLTKV